MTDQSEIHRSGFGPAQADCKQCELRGVCLKVGYVEGERPADWQPGGLMLIGEGPGKVEASLRRPFVGPSGRLIDALLEAAGLDRKKVWVTNATLGLPPFGKDAAFHDRFPQAIYSCLPRLEAEIEAAQPRVIVTLGQAALIALSGYEVQRKRIVSVPCSNVDCVPETRKLRTLGIACAAPDCDWFMRIGPMRPPEDADDATVAAFDAEVAVARDAAMDELRGQCPRCTANIRRLRPRIVKCPTCKGKKRQVEDYTLFEHDYTLVGREGVAGAVFPTRELSSRLDELGVEYVIPTYHPSYCLRPVRKATKIIGGQFAARVLVEHLDKARRLLRSDPTFAAGVRVVERAEEIDAFVRDTQRSYAVDIETNSEDGAWGCTKITCIGISCAEDKTGLVVDTRGISDPYAPHPMLDALHRFLSDPKRAKLFHNGQFDRVVIARLWGIDVAGVVSDTILSHHALYPDEEQGLGFCAHELLDAPHWKASKKRKLKVGEKDDLGGYESFEALALYNARDTRSTALIDQVMRGTHGGRGRMDVERVRAAHDMDVVMQEVSIGMELAGLPLSRGILAEVRASAEAVVAEELAEMRQILGAPEWEPGGKALLWAMFDPEGPLRLEPFGYTDTGLPVTSKEALARMTDQHPFVPRLLRYRKYEYVLTHYVHGETLRVQPDGRLHPQWKVYGTTTGRWVSNPNFQNWSKNAKDATLNLRGLIVAPPGRKLVGADYAALELRVMADLSADEGLITRLVNSDEGDKLNPDRDLHAYIASRTFGATYLNGTKDEKKVLRDTEKRIIYGANYGAGEQTILESIYNAGYEGPPITIRMVGAVLTTIRKEFPGITRWRETQVRKAGETREVRSPLLGRRRIFPLGEIDATICYNYAIQSGAADVMNSRLAVLAQRLPQVDPTAVFIAQVHDAIYIECDEKRATQVAQLVTETLTVELALGGGPKMLYSASADVADSWDKC